MANAFVPGYRNDVFVSYAHVNNQPLMSGENGWVSALVSNLCIKIAEYLGRNQFSLWIDAELRGNNPITPEILTELSASATLLVILSQGYLASSWCQDELKRFIEREGANSRRIFVIELYKTDRPRGIDDLRGYRFWYLDKAKRERQYAVPRPVEPEYFNLVQDVAQDLSDTLNALKASAKGVAPEAKPAWRKENTVFLSIVPDSLQQDRNQFRRYLEQKQVTVLPERHYQLADFQSTLDEDLQKSAVFVQLLDLDTSFGMPRHQYERALIHAMPIVQWRAPTLDIPETLPEQHRNLLHSAHVHAMSLVEFQAYVYRQLSSAKEPMEPTDDVLVFLDAAPEDRLLAQTLKDFFAEQGIAYSVNLPIEVTSSVGVEQVRKDLEENLLECEAVVVLYGDTRVVWVREQLHYCRKMIGKRDRPLRVLAVYMPPPTGQPKIPIDMNLPRQKLQIIEKPLAEFLNELPRLLGRQVT